MKKRRSSIPRKLPKSQRAQKQASNSRFWFGVLAFGLAVYLLYLMVLYIVPVIFAAAAALLGWWATKLPSGSRRNWVVGAGVMGLVALILFPQRANTLRAEETSRVASERNIELQAQQRQAQAKQLQAQAQEKQRLNMLALENAKPGLRGTVLKIIDGETMKVKLSDGSLKTVRLLGIDAPELNQQDWGEQARQALKSMVDESKVRLAQDGRQRDNQGRLLAYVWRGNTLINHELVKRGLVDLDPSKAKLQYASSFREAKIAARDQGLGIWSSEDGLELSPTAFRRGRCLATAGETLGTQPETKALNEGLDCAVLKKYAAVVKDGKNYVYATPKQSFETNPEPQVQEDVTTSEPQTQEVYFSSCREARAAGYSNMTQGSPGYSSSLDRDDDGIACER